MFHNVLPPAHLRPFVLCYFFLMSFCTNTYAFNRFCVMKLTERLKQEGIDINLRDALGVDTDPKLRNLRGKL